MKQAYFTFCCTGPQKSLSGFGGDLPRAAVKGVSEHELLVYKRFCSYPQYSRETRQEFQTELLTRSDWLTFDPLARLVFGSVSNDDAENSSCHHFLAHSVYAEPDKETKRDGNYFSHLIYPIPSSWTVSTALETWGSSFWVTCDSDDIVPELPSISDEGKISSGIVNRNSFVQFLHSSQERQKKFLFLIKSLLLSDSNTIVLTGIPEDMVFCLWGATQCLPPSVWNNITFSTHEKPAMSFPFSIVNVPLPETLNSQVETVFKELPNLQNTLLYSENPRFISSELPDIPFIDIIFEMCLNDSFEMLNQFYAALPDDITYSGDLLQLFWTFLNQPDRISYEDIGRGLEIPSLKNRAIDALMNNTRFSLDDQIAFFHALFPQFQDRVLNRLISENSIEQIRNNRGYSQLLVSVLSSQETQSENNQSFFQRILDFFKKVLSE